jgi:endo-1,4-beta-xylanase
MDFKRLIIAFGLLVLAMTIAFSMGCQNQPTGPQGITEIGAGNLLQSSKAREKFLGNIHNSGRDPANFTRYWNQVTPGNPGKWAECESSRDQYSWSQLDAAYNFARSNGFPFKEHCLVWGFSQGEPSWLSGLSESEQREEIEEWIRDFGERYSPDLVDVVNEPINDPPYFADALGGDGSSGWDWVLWCYQKAEQYVSGVKIVNEYDILNGGVSTSEIIGLADVLKNNGIDVAIGCQGHFLEDQSASDVRSRLTQIKNAGYSIYISELDIEGSDSEQLRIYQELFPVLWENSEGVTHWGYIQGQMWRSEAYLVKYDGSMRPAMDWLMDNYGSGSGSTTTTTSGGYTTTTSGSSWWGGGSWWGSTTTTSGYTTTTTVFTTTTLASTTTTSSSTWWGGGSWWGSTTTTGGYTTTTAASSWWGGGSWW